MGFEVSERRCRLLWEGGEVDEEAGRFSILLASGAATWLAARRASTSAERAAQRHSSTARTRAVRQRLACVDARPSTNGAGPGANGASVKEDKESTNSAGAGGRRSARNPRARAKRRRPATARSRARARPRRREPRTTRARRRRARHWRASHTKPRSRRAPATNRRVEAEAPSAKITGIGTNHARDCPPQRRGQKRSRAARSGAGDGRAQPEEFPRWRHGDLPVGFRRRKSPPTLAGPKWTARTGGAPTST